MSGQKAATMCGRALRGLFAGRSMRFGNNVSEGGGNKTRRSWKPNAMRKRVFSDLLGRMVPIYLTAHTLRCIDKAGGLDNYVLNARPQELGTGVGPQLLHELTLAREARGRVPQAQPPPAPAPQ